ncbi:MAG: hypothetical protein J0L93_08165 [Deltaproteobacteria bacterium]|nr:hypothetical protein [Deltaproteobacteria bacterium]
MKFLGFFVLSFVSFQNAFAEAWLSRTEEDQYILSLKTQGIEKDFLLSKNPFKNSLKKDGRNYDYAFYVKKINDYSEISERRPRLSYEKRNFLLNESEILRQIEILESHSLIHEGVHESIQVEEKFKELKPGVIQSMRQVQARASSSAQFFRGLGIGAGAITLATYHPQFWMYMLTAQPAPIIMSTSLLVGSLLNRKFESALKKIFPSIMYGVPKPIQVATRYSGGVFGAGCGIILSAIAQNNYLIP